MDREEYNKYFQRFAQFWEQCNKSRIECETAAEKYFFELMKLFISLSTALLAFIALFRDILHRELSDIDKITTLSGYFVAILFAVLAIVSLAIHYLHFTNKYNNKLRRIFNAYNIKHYDEVNRIISEETQKFKENRDDEWQIPTIVLGVLAFAAFAFSTFWLVSKILF